MQKQTDQQARKHTLILLLAVISILLVLILVLFPKPGVPGPEPAQPQNTEPGPGAANSNPKQTGSEDNTNTVKTLPRAELSIIIDDAGYNLNELRPFLELNLPLTFAVLPHLIYSRQASALITDKGFEVILHMPMEPLGTNDPGPGAIYSGMDRRTVYDLLDQAFESVPEAAGLNNHMGSRIMGEPESLDIIFDYVKQKNIFFLDSLTASPAEARLAAEDKQIPYLERNVFLDNDPSLAAVQAQLNEGILTARAGGSAILIGHVQNPNVVTALKELAGQLEDQNIIVVPLIEQLTKK